MNIKGDFTGDFRIFFEENQKKKGQIPRQWSQWGGEDEIFTRAEGTDGLYGWNFPKAVKKTFVDWTV